ncbi:hypothetical protein MAH1_33680 [Sessilibacter sp. MAH1]
MNDLSVRDLEVLLLALESAGRMRNGTAISEEMRELYVRILKERKCRVG